MNCKITAAFFISHYEDIARKLYMGIQLLNKGKSDLLSPYGLLLCCFNFVILLKSYTLFIFIICHIINIVNVQNIEKIIST
jgi:hypothetical protein